MTAMVLLGPEFYCIVIVIICMVLSLRWCYQAREAPNYKPTMSTDTGLTQYGSGLSETALGLRV